MEIGLFRTGLDISFDANSVAAEETAIFKPDRNLIVSFANDRLDLQPVSKFVPRNLWLTCIYPFAVADLQERIRRESRKFCDRINQLWFDRLSCLKCVLIWKFINRRNANPAKTTFDQYRAVKPTELVIQCEHAQNWVIKLNR